MLRTHHQLALAALAAGALTLLWLAGAMRSFDLPLGDLLLRLTRPGAADEAPVAAVVIDDESLDHFGGLPWPRARLAEVVERVFAAGARAVVLDLILADPGDQASDLALAQALARGEHVLAASLRPDGGWLLPGERFGGPRRAAHAEAEIGPDGVVRSILATKQRAGRALPALSLAAARVLRPQIPIVPGELLRPDFRLPPDRVPRRNAAAVLAPVGRTPDGRTPEGRTPATDLGFLDGRLVFVGLSASGAGDRFVVPTRRQRPTPGVLIHASAAASILAGGLLRPLGTAGVTMLCLLLAGAAQIARSRTGSLKLSHMLAILAALLAAAAATLALARLQLPLATLAAAFGLSALLREVIESGLARRETGQLLRGLVAESSDGEGSVPEPRGASGRLELARELQTRLIRDRNLRRALLDALEDGVVRWDGKGEPVLANAAALRLWGGPPGFDEATTGSEAGGVHRRGGRELKVATRRLEGGHLGVIRDVTAERELESRRREMQRMVSHELKTPLAAIGSFGSMLQRYDLTGEELERLAGLIRGESDRLLDMVTTYLDLERLGGGEEEQAELDLGELAGERLEILEAAAGRRGQSLKLARRGAATVTGDRQLLARVIDNLAGNALKYSPPGSAVEIEVREVGRWIELEVRDEGPGIPPEALPRIFERFYRVPGSGSAGSGLGLALVREIAEWHGGCVEVDSEPGAGSAFRVRLPARGTGGPDPGRPDPGRPDPGKR